MEYYPADVRIPIGDAEPHKTPEQRALINVRYPAVIKNLDKAFETFEGTRGLLKAYKTDNKRLELRWRKDDIYCKPLYGDRTNSTNLLLRVKRRYKKNSKESETDIKYEYNVTVEGFIFTTYKFSAMADYQYLPVERKDDGTYRNMLSDLELTGNVSRENFLSRDVPLFMPPMIFSRIDTPVEYLYRPDKVMTKSVQKGLEHLPPNLIGTGRQRRTIYTIFKTFDEETPNGPPDGATKYLMTKLKNSTLLDMIKKLFEERPIWSKNGLRCNIPVKYDPRLKYVLPLVAYYFCNGPWRTLWVKFGYDPRKDKSSKKYQVLDFRLRQRGAAERLEIGGKRSSFDYNLPTVKSRSNLKTPQINKFALGPKSAATGDSTQVLESTYVFYPDILPPYRQMFYQFCDVHEEEVQKLVHQNDGKEVGCFEKEGWLEPDVHDKSREILFKHVDSILGRQLFPIVDPGTKRGRRIVNKIRGMLDATEESDEDSEEEAIMPEMEEEEEEELNEMETEMMDCV